MPLEDLPPEIWILIIDILTESISNPIHDCNHMNFPQIDDALRHPRPLFRHHPVYKHTRLVCRLFREILASPPRLFMKEGRTQVPAGTRAVYITAKAAPLRCFEGLLKDPSRSRRISTLDMRVADNSEEIPSFDFLCQNAHLLSGVRSLALDIGTDQATTLDIRVWEGINRAFPELVCLVLRPRTGTGQTTSTRGEGRVVTFKKLEVLELNQVSLYPGLTLPALRHVALGCWYQHGVEVLLRSPLLESLLVRTLPYAGWTDRVDTTQLKTLKLLGIPIYGGDMNPTLPPDYPLHHICLYIPGFAEGPSPVERVKKMPGLFPRLSRITIDVTEVSYGRRAIVESPFRCINPELRPSGLVIKELLPMTSFIVIDRIVEEPKVDSPPPVTLAPPSDSTWDRFNRLRESTSRIFHI